MVGEQARTPGTFHLQEGTLIFEMLDEIGDNHFGLVLLALLLWTSSHPEVLVQVPQMSVSEWFEVSLLLLPAMRALLQIAGHLRQT